MPKTDPIDELAAIQREAWLADLDLRRQAATDPALAQIVADADAQYLAEYGHAWVNPLAAEEPT